MLNLALTGVHAHLHGIICRETTNIVENLVDGDEDLPKNNGQIYLFEDCKPFGGLPLGQDG